MSSDVTCPLNVWFFGFGSAIHYKDAMKETRYVYMQKGHRHDRFLVCIFTSGELFMKTLCFERHPVTRHSMTYIDESTSSHIAC